MSIHQRPAELLQHLIRFDTTNPPGHERALLEYVAGILRDYGIESQMVARDPERPNLIARLPGRGDAPPLLLQGHVDVVTTQGQNWQHPPFAGDLVDGWVWGRGALDMKGGVVMLLTAFLRAKAENLATPGGLILSLMSDEEAGSDYGAKFLTTEHKHLFEGVKYALGEFGGFSMTLAGQRFYPIMVGERAASPLRVTVRGPGGHGAQPMRGGAMAKAARLLLALDGQLLPPRITPTVRAMVEAIAAALPPETGKLFLRLLDPAQTDAALDILGDQARMLRPLLRNTVNATIIQGGNKINVIPSAIEIQLDTRTLPGVTPDDVISEVRAIIGDEPDIEVIKVSRGTPPPDMHHFETLAQILREADPNGVPIPYLVSGGTDASEFSKIGIQTYGFLPMLLPEDFAFSGVIHAADERIPVSALEFGCAAVYTAIQRIGA
jgi:acetylornithine deacetylase/succinyl-diaminopimelate desuccinylase-like protein